MLDRSSQADAQTQLLRRIAAKDRQALVEFYDQSARPIFSVAVRILGDAAEAEEVTQDVFVQIWEKASTFNSALGLPFHWALGITRNRCIDRLRAQQRRYRTLEAAAQEASVSSASDTSPAGRSLHEDEIAVVRSAVQHLPADQLQAIEMAFFGGMTHEEIAAALHQPLGTIKARIRRGMLKLRESLKAYA